MIVVGFFEVYVIAYVYGFNRFMNDVKMMLGKRAAEYYLFLTWCIVSLILMLVSKKTGLLKSIRNENIFIKIIIFSKLITFAPMKNSASAGYDAYEFPQWSTILGWFIFVACVLPIPLVYLVKYIKAFREMYLAKIVR
jgi:hypothetical protein